MTFIPVNLDDAQEAKPVPAGIYNLQIVTAEEVLTGPNANNPGRPQFKVSIGFPDKPNTPNMWHFISLPYEGDDPDKMQFKMLLLRRFLHLFSVPYDTAGIDTEKLAMSMVGATASAEVTQVERNDNTYNQLVVPRLRGEAESAASTGRRRRA